jgi:hypothetical protein
VSRDRIGYRGGDANLYNYVRNRTTVLTDASGDVGSIIIGGGIALAWYFFTPNNAHAPGNDFEVANAEYLDQLQNQQNIGTTVSLLTIPVGGYAAGAARTCSARIAVRIVCSGAAGGTTHQLATDALTGQVLNYYSHPTVTLQNYGTSVAFWTGGAALGEGFEAVRPYFGGPVYNIGGAGELPPRPNIVNQQPPFATDSHWGVSRPGYGVGSGATLQDLVDAGHNMHIAPNGNLGLRPRTACRVVYNNMAPPGTPGWPTSGQLNELVRPNTGWRPGGQVYIDGQPTLVYPGLPLVPDGNIQMERR